MDDPDYMAERAGRFAKPQLADVWLRTRCAYTKAPQLPNAQAQLPLEQPKAAEGTQSAPALWAVNCSASLG
jgi:hypothetical protein